MIEKTILALRNAEETYINLKEGSSKQHIIALHALFDSFIYYGFAVSQVTDAITYLENDTYLFETLIEPHLRVVDDVDMIARQYMHMYVQYIAKIAGGEKSEKAIESLFN
ncbi:hypothetical protein JHD50_05975 [Sulfurimonas sp. MAG313]|nr:hypothetical protein [Sulfurimonas sp. MAG313]MDF1880857.1 hypothetical protein [Sulfurimonas sp. MAG313]